MLVIPHRLGEGVRLRVLRPDQVDPAVAALDGKWLHLPRASETPRRVPYLRMLGWMAWLARGAHDVAAEVHTEMEQSLVASQSSEGNRKLVAALTKARASHRAAHSEA